MFFKERCIEKYISFFLFFKHFLLVLLYIICYNKLLKESLYKVDRVWTLKYIDEYFKDVLNSVDTLNPEVRQAYLNWYVDIPEPIRNNMTTGRVESNDIPYHLLDRARVTEYAMYDIVWTMELYLQLRPAITARGNEEALAREECMIPALVRMESCGFQIDEGYVPMAVTDYTGLNHEGNNVSLENEMMQTAKTGTQYTILSTLLGKSFDGLQQVIKGQ